jgi:hypothetical protein
LPSALLLLGCSTELTVIQPLSQVLNKLVTSSALSLRKSTPHGMFSAPPDPYMIWLFPLHYHYHYVSLGLQRPWPPWFSSSLAYTHLAHLFSQPAAKLTETN